MAQMNQPLVPLAQLSPDGKTDRSVGGQRPAGAFRPLPIAMERVRRQALHGEKMVDVPAINAVMVERLDLSPIPADTRMANMELTLSDAAGKVLSRYRREVFLTCGATTTCPDREPSRLFDQMSPTKPFVVRSGQRVPCASGRDSPALLKSLSLDPLPARVPLDVHQGEPLDHPWCTVRRVCYQIWPHVYADTLLYMPKHRPSVPPRPSSRLRPLGMRRRLSHFEQQRCLNFARLGYVVLEPVQNHYEDLNIGISHQTLTTGTTCRALDLLESLPEVDPTASASAAARAGDAKRNARGPGFTREGGDCRGMCCDFRRILYPDNPTVGCNHYPGVMRLYRCPEISTLGSAGRRPVFDDVRLDVCLPAR